MSATGRAPRVISKSIKHGIGRLTASAERRHPNIQHGRSTRLTQVAHKAPTRLVPLGKSSVAQAGAAICALSNYGAGMLQGDSMELTVKVETGAKLGLLTQGANRIYTPNQHNNTVNQQCHATMEVTVEQDAFFVFAPDPCVMFANSSFTQTQYFFIHPHSSVALIDWFSSGRFMNQEQWQFDVLHTRTSLYWLDEAIDQQSGLVTHVGNIPFLQDATLMDLRSSRGYQVDSKLLMDSYALEGFNCFASLILYGNDTQKILERCHKLSEEFASQVTRIRQRDPDSDLLVESNSITPKSSQELLGKMGLSSRVVMGVSKVTLSEKPSDAYVIRFAGKTNEDLYRVLHDGLLPVADQFGLQFYKERIRAHRSEIKQRPLMGSVSCNPIQEKPINDDAVDIQTFVGSSYASNDVIAKNPISSLMSSSSTSFWSIVMLADSGLPTGSFAHSAGLEAAAQLKLIQTKEEVENFVIAATRSAMQVSTAFLIAGHHIATSSNGDVDAITISEQWDELHRQCQAVMGPNQPACSASIDQGKSISRVALQWLQQEKTTGLLHGSHRDEILRRLRDNPSHIAPAIGVIGGMLGLNATEVCRLFAYCVARDLVSAAVRLSLIGPLSSIPLLSRLQVAAEDGTRVAAARIVEHPYDPLTAAAASAPIIEALHPCHELLQVRLFRS